MHTFTYVAALFSLSFVVVLFFNSYIYVVNLCTFSYAVVWLFLHPFPVYPHSHTYIYTFISTNKHVYPHFLLLQQYFCLFYLCKCMCVISMQLYVRMEKKLNLQDNTRFKVIPIITKSTLPEHNNVHICLK